MAMKLILAQPAVKRFQWELEVLLANIRQFGDFDVVLLFTRHDDTVPQYLADKYGARCFVYEDRRTDKSYIPSVRPWLLWQYLKGDPAREQEQYFYIDADIIFREWPDFATLSSDPKMVPGSDCDSYIGYDYLISRRNGQDIVNNMATICGITPEQMYGVPGIGAQILLNQPKAEFWRRAYNDSNAIYEYFRWVDSDVQKWTAEMWAQQWGWVRDGIRPVIATELDFCRPTDDLIVWDTVKIMHNAGVLGSEELFFKGKYVDTMPFDDDLSYVNPKKVSIKYVEAIKNVTIN